MNDSIEPIIHYLGAFFYDIEVIPSRYIITLAFCNSQPISEKFNEFSNDHSLLISHHEKYVSIDPEKITCPQCIKRYHDVKKNKPEDLYSPSNFKLNYPPNNDPFKFFEND